jgi:hypothetical protein
MPTEYRAACIELAEILAEREENPESNPRIAALRDGASIERALCYDCAPCNTTHHTELYPRCGGCGACASSCACDTAEGCGCSVDPSRVCECGACFSCCRCTDAGGRTAPDLERNPLTFFRGGRPTPLFPYSRTLAAELEFYGGGAAGPAIRRWAMTCKLDGSVPGGREIAMSPANGAMFERQANDLCRLLGASNARVDHTCGLHVHVDVGDYNYPAYARLIWLWAHIENAVYSLLPRSRRDNGYCKPRAPQFARIAGEARPVTAADARRIVIACIAESADGEPSRWSFGTTKEYEKAMVEWAKCRARNVPFVAKSREERTKFKKLAGKENARPSSPGGERYFGLNFQSAFTHGTVEFRCHTGTVEAHKIKHWAALCASIVERAKTAKVSDLCARDPWVTILDLCKTEEQRQYFIDRRAQFVR